jgi:hypothetical protein
MGFHDAATMLAYQQRQREMMRGPANAGVGNVMNMPINMDTARKALAIHPAMLFQSILDKLNGVM